MNKMKYIIQILIAITLWSCTDEEIFKSKGDIEVTAGFAKTRTTFVEDDGVTHVTWNTKDVIGLFTKEQNNLQYMALNDGDETKFEGESLKAQEGEKVYAYYPWIDGSKNPQKIKLPDIQFQSYNNNRFDFIYASSSVNDRRVSLQFKHLFAFLKITLPVDILMSEEHDNLGLYIRSSENIAFQDVYNEGKVYFNIEKEEIVAERFSQSLQYNIPKKSLEGQQEITCYIAILPQTEDAELQIDLRVGKPLLAKNVPAGGFKAGNVYALYLNGDEVENMKAREREALIALYKATNGDNWTNNTNWCSDKPIHEWYGVGIDSYELERVHYLHLENNNLSGVIPEEIGNLENLKSLYFNGNNLNGSLPTSIGNLKKLKELSLAYNELNSIPENIGTLESLEILDIGSNLLSGNIPTSICELKNITHLSLGFNQLTGNLPENIGNLKKISNLSVSNNQLTGNLPESLGRLTNLTEVYISNNQFIGNLPESMKNLKQLKRLEATRCNLEGQIPKWLKDLPSLQDLNLAFNRFSGSVPMEIWEKWGGSISAQLPGYIVSPEDYYVSTDFSKDGEITVMQTHSKGSGIKLVFMGDLFVDKDMGEGGKYETLMKLAMENYFSIEPIKSLREYFDVMAIKAVSENDWMSGNTAFETRHSASGTMDYNHEKCQEYALKATECNNLNNIHVVLVNLGAGAQLDYYNNLGFSIACCRYSEKDPAGFKPLLHQVAIGFGIGLLCSEFTYPNDTSSPTSSDIESYKRLYDETGEYANIDFTADLSKIRWAHFINDTRYEGEGIGAYEGAKWRYGAYRPTEHGIMRNNLVQQFNAPSREAIYKRVMKLAYGDSWTYDYEEFVKFDKQGHDDWMEAINKVNTRSVQSDSRVQCIPKFFNYPAVVKQ